jgi:formylglycine-generating enzyme
MRRITFLLLMVTVWSAGVIGDSSRADTFGTGANAVEIEFVPIGNPGNPPDTEGNPKPVAGSVPYGYRITKYEVSERMIESANALGSLDITKDVRGPDMPATSVSWVEAAGFVNWLNTSIGHMPAYKFDGSGVLQLWEPSDLGYNPSNRFRNRLASYFLPSVDEWYKAAYFDPTTNGYRLYPTGSDNPPTAVSSGASPNTAVYSVNGPAPITQAGGLSPYGTMAQGGNVAEWNETNLNAELMEIPGTSGALIRGGSWTSIHNTLSNRALSSGFRSSGFVELGFRVASNIPEPTALALFGLAVIGIVGANFKMGLMRPILCLLLSVLTSSIGPIAGSAWADTFGSGANAFDIEFVTIGNPGNPPDANPNPAGAVPYEFRISKYEVSEQMIDKANALGGLGITKDSRGSNKPATSVSWYEAARLVNWLNTSTGGVPAYKFDDTGVFQLWSPSDAGYNSGNLYRNRLARYFLPSIDEWHKAAYYDPVVGVYYDYPTGSDLVPDGIDFSGDMTFDAVFDDGGMNPQPNDVTAVGLLSRFGTAGQGGNVAEWDETAFDRVNDNVLEHRRASGGAWTSTERVLRASNTLIGDGPSFEGNFIGIRIGSTIPEPNAFLILAIGFLICSGARFPR